LSGFVVTAEQRELVDTIVRPLDALFPISRLHTGHGSEREKWRQIAELGWLAACLPESAGGVGLTAVEETLMFERFGCNLLAPAVFATAAAAALAADAGDEALAQAFADGSKTAALGITVAGSSGGALVDPGNAQFALSLDADTAKLIPLSTQSDPLCDASLWSLPLASASFDNPSHRCGDPMITSLIRLLLAAQLAGIAKATLAMAVEYAGTREQFGQRIGSFQAIKHHCADMAMHALAATDLLSFAAIAVSQRREDAHFQVLTALSVALRAAHHNAHLNVQIHGGMGFSDECDAHLFVKRALLLGQAAGGLSMIRGLTSNAAAPA
jgi:alkylation response protein AidB-like acyl-CoA dehydrogenase